MTSRNFSNALAALALLLSALAPASAQGIDPDDLLPVEQAFALTARLAAPDRIELRWEIAEGYYLYRHRLSVRDAQGFAPGELVLPEGKQYTDEFFGDVETYRDELIATLPITVEPGAAEAVFQIGSQGCADIGVCYPPQRETVRLALSPIASAVAGAAPAPVKQPDAAQALFQALGAAPGQGVAQGTAPDGSSVALPLPPEQAFGFEAIAVSPGSLLLRFAPASGYYLYRDRSSFAIEGADIDMGEPAWPPATSHFDDHFGDVAVYFDEVEVPLAVIRLAAGPAQTARLTATFQGCQTDGICYPPMTRAIDVVLPAAMATDVGPAMAAPQAGAELAEDSRLAAALGGPDTAWTLLMFFGFGLLLAFTPCVFPMVPILSGIIAGAGDISTRRAFTLSLVYVLAMALVFTLAGVIAGLLGANLAAAFQQPWILTAFALLFVALAFSMFGFYELQLPTSWQTRLAELSNKQSGGSLIGVAIMGVLSALIVGPCVAPPLAAAVLYISQSRDPILGGLALFSLALGMGAPLLLFGTAAGRWLPRAGAWMDAVKAVFGVTFLGLAIWMLDRFLDPVWIMAMVGALLVGCAVYLRALEPIEPGASGWKRLWKALGLMLLLAGAAQLIGAMAGGRDLFQPLKGVFGGGAVVEAKLNFAKVKSIDDLQTAIAAANAAGKPVMFDFYADWCVACKEMEKYTFTKPEVHAALADFVLLKADVTANDDIDQALMKHFGIIGPPATLWFGLDGVEQRGLRLIGFENAPKFVDRVGKVRR
ncbi:MAG: protein-disulfide reductase DsbD [Xanthomonadaceae bacterium]|nr:protein-disulfide reductase DsbD [Xanthomonadaceae bacterium]